MTDEAVIKGTYIQLQTYKERPYVTLHIDFPEEMHQEIVQKLGVPTKGTSKWLAVALLDMSNNSSSSIVTKPETNCDVVKKSEGEKLLALSHIRCKDKQFQEYVDELGWNELEPKDNATDYLYDFCNITSRSELTTDVAAQKLFRELDQKFKKWWSDKQWETINQDNLNREG